jgi:hypothetical protein
VVNLLLKFVEIITDIMIEEPKEKEEEKVKVEEISMQEETKKGEEEPSEMKTVEEEEQESKEAEEVDQEGKEGQVDPPEESDKIDDPISEKTLFDQEINENTETVKDSERMEDEEFERRVKKGTNRYNDNMIVYNIYLEQEGLIKIGTVANDIVNLQGEIKSLHNEAGKMKIKKMFLRCCYKEQLDMEELSRDPRSGLKLVDTLRKKCLKYGEELMRDLLALDEIVTSQQSRPIRKEQVLFCMSIACNLGNCCRSRRYKICWRMWMLSILNCKNFKRA